MASKRVFQLIVVLAILVTSFASTGSASAGGGCANYITVQWGDTLNSVAALCGTTAEAIQAANPGLGWWLYAGQVLYIPTGYAASAPAAPSSLGGAYTIQWGDTLGDVAARKGVSLSSLLAANPQIWNINLIYPGQVINLPAGVGFNTPPIYIPAPGVSPYGTLKVSYGYGLLVRNGPGKNYAEIQSLLVSAVKDSTWQYRKNSLTIDSSGFVWVEVTLNPMVQGYSTGWILVRDTLGNYFTEPHIDP